MRTADPQARRGTTRPSRGGTWRALAVLATVAALFGTGAVSANAATARPAHSSATLASKPTPVPPAGIPVGKVTAPAKPHTAKQAAIRPLTAISVTLTASPSVLWPTQFTTLTATASQDVGATPYDIFIYDDLTNSVVCQVITGTTCQVAETKPTPGSDDYFAYVSVASDTNGTQAVAFSSTVVVDWEGVTLTLSASAHTVAVGTAVTLSATSNLDVGPSPFFIEIWDATTGTLLNTGSCGFGTACPAAGQASIVVSQSAATTHSYVATLGLNSSTYPPAELQTTSGANYVTWTASGYQVALSAPAVVVNGPTPVTVKANIDVAPTPYFIEVFDETTGTRIAAFAGGSAQTFNYEVGRTGTDTLVAFISNGSSLLPPGNIQASSNTISVSEEFIG
jgi:hypothetical protein